VTDGEHARRGLEPHFWPGIALLAVGQVLIFARGDAGAHLRPWSDYWFASVWFGYILVLDALLYRRDARSLIVSDRPVFLAMLPLSALLWYGFEALNGVVHNWQYEHPADVPEWWARIWVSIFFSTVIPAIWLTAAWVHGWPALQRLTGLRTFEVSRRALGTWMGLGVVSFLLAILWPRHCFPLIWGFLVMLLDPLNYLRGAPSMLGFLARGDWRVPAAVYLGGHICGLLWEFWNFWAFPRWTYTIPFVDFWKIFEMPLLGYLGYGPFAWTVYAVCQLAAGLLPARDKARALLSEGVALRGGSSLLEVRVRG
jgi:hypothetical protein